MWRATWNKEFVGQNHGIKLTERQKTSSNFPQDFMEFNRFACDLIFGGKSDATLQKLYKFIRFYTYFYLRFSFSYDFFDRKQQKET